MARFALAIGLNKYYNITIASLKFAAADAEEFASIVSRPGSYRIPAENLTVLLDSDATRLAIIEAVNGLVERSGPEDPRRQLFLCSGVN